MAKLIVSQLMSLDGHLAGPGGDLSGLPMGAAFDQHNLELLRRAGTLVFGRTTFGMFEGYWPQVERDASAEPVQREIASLVRSVGKLVVSDTLVRGPDAAWPDAEVVRRAASRARVAQLKAGAGRDLLMYGGTMVWQDLFAAGLVDELHLLVGNVVLGAGVPLFAPGVTQRISLLGQRHLPGSEIVALHFEVSPRD
ncbi:dihydrofolate reductase family protein [Piscinibacter sp. HJYY11]|uniref:dihydrofolate reductase family protein n=1 Tax=Piscinibacter sp. HJYY11 TaxID=2801333 RepID=UPI00191F2AE5|nr:dihydrofolate reductase family protein [Piscinibacter sp. HJYY11]MBL0729838.1 dihydrofolate reductase family protein [Piscinibacter sp. HJYY11]